MWKSNIKLIVAFLTINLVWLGIIYFTNLTKFTVLVAILAVMFPIILAYLGKNRVWYVLLGVLVLQVVLQFIIFDFAQEDIVNKDGIIISAEIYEQGEEISATKKYIRCRYKIRNEDFSFRVKVSDEFYEELDDSIEIKVSVSKPWMHEFLEPVL